MYLCSFFVALVYSSSSWALVSFVSAKQVYHFRNTQRRRLEPGMVFTIEPILAEGSGDVFTWNDGWTAATRDNGW
jgi:methionine aminopeptidase